MRPPDTDTYVAGATRKRAFRLLFFCLVCVGIGQSMLFAILPPVAREIGLTPFQVSTIFATSATIWVFVSPLWGRRSDTWGRRPVILIGLLGFALSMALLATMIQIGLWQLLPVMLVYPLMIAARCVFALLGSGTGPAAQAYVADRTDSDERTAGVALINAAMGFGQTLGPATGAVLATIGLLAPLYFAALLAVASAVTVWLFLPEKGPPVHAGSAAPPPVRPWDRRILPFLGIGASLQAVQATNAIVLAFFLQDTLGLSAQSTVQYAGVGFVGLAVAGLFAQLVLVQRLKPKASTMIGSGVPLILAACLLLALAGSFALCLAALVSMGLGLGLARPGNAAAASLSVSAEEQGSVAGMLSGIVVIGNIFGPLVGTAVYSLHTTAPYLLDAVLMAGITGLVIGHRRVRSV